MPPRRHRRPPWKSPRVDDFSYRRYPPARDSGHYSTVTEVPDGALATIGQRVGARVLDLLIIGGPFVVLSWVVSDVDIEHRVFDRPTWVLWLGLTIGVLYEVVPIAWIGQTVGKRLMDIRVVSTTDLRPPALGRALARAIPVLANPIPVAGPLASLLYLPMFWRPQRRGLHDQLAGTVVLSSDY